MARNKRRKSAKRTQKICKANAENLQSAIYKGVANVTCRRARKGFQLKYNCDTHWSAALYRGLNHLQYSDGKNIANINRDDAAGFRLDTMSTHRLQKTPMVQGKSALTTYTDFVHPYTSILQTTSYNFSRTKTTSELCAGVVKPTGLFCKNPAQHAADLDMLDDTPEFPPVFMNPVTGKIKEIECVRVDGAADEGPSHEEVQFYWTSRHYEKGYVATLVSARSSGSSFMNCKMGALHWDIPMSLFHQLWLGQTWTQTQANSTRRTIQRNGSIHKSC